MLERYDVARVAHDADRALLLSRGVDAPAWSVLHAQEETRLRVDAVIDGRAPDFGGDAEREVLLRAIVAALRPPKKVEPVVVAAAQPIETDVVAAVEPIESDVVAA